ncbi:MAG: hypothetical protein GX045_00720 [Clostridiaceae bacterium]|jgi:hypothetical protein|nr:hypothetical protein [Clostridiaceae bacterium]
MEVFVKILAFLLLAAGAFIVYGAKLIAFRMMKSATNIDNKNNKDFNPPDENNPEAVNEDEEHTFTENDYKTEKQIVNIKITGMFFIIAGVILVLFAFR